MFVLPVDDYGSRQDGGRTIDPRQPFRSQGCIYFVYLTVEVGAYISPVTSRSSISYLNVYDIARPSVRILCSRTDRYHDCSALRCLCTGPRRQSIRLLPQVVRQRSSSPQRSIRGGTSTLSLRDLVDRSQPGSPSQPVSSLHLRIASQRRLPTSSSIGTSGSTLRRTTTQRILLCRSKSKRQQRKGHGRCWWQCAMKRAMRACVSTIALRSLPSPLKVDSGGK